jgi:aspartate racemase
MAESTGKHIGIVAVSAEGAALCYRTICNEGPRLLGAHRHPPVTMHTPPFHLYMERLERADWESIGRLMLQSASLLEAAGAELLICPDNTVHEALDLVRDEAPLPWLHIAEEVATTALRHGYRRVGVLGTRWLMEGPVYSDALATVGIAPVVPEADERQRLHDLIFEELVEGQFERHTRQIVQQMIQDLGEQGCEAVVLGCTEIPLLIEEEDSPLPTLDSTRILARAALREATRDLIS